MVKDLVQKFLKRFAFYNQYEYRFCNMKNKNLNTVASVVGIFAFASMAVSSVASADSAKNHISVVG
jgi:hypothetical protein